jgi:hypothetical protein
MALKTYFEERPRLLLYSLLLPIVWFTLGLAMHAAFPGKRLGMVGLVAVVFLVVWLISWHFAKTFRRHFSKPERLKLVLYCSLWAAFMELLALYSIIADQADAGQSPLGAEGLLGIAGFTVALDTLILWAAFTFTAKKFIDAQLSKHSAA